MRLAPFGQIEISGPDIPRVSVEHIESAAQRASREKIEARASAAKGKRPPLERFRAFASGAGYPGPGLFSRNLDAVGSP
jgi:hypothetical protein